MTLEETFRAFVPTRYEPSNLTLNLGFSSVPFHRELIVSSELWVKVIERDFLEERMSDFQALGDLSRGPFLASRETLPSLSPLNFVRREASMKLTVAREIANCSAFS